MGGFSNYVATCLRGVWKCICLFRHARMVVLELSVFAGPCKMYLREYASWVCGLYITLCLCRVCVRACVREYVCVCEHAPVTVCVCVHVCLRVPAPDSVFVWVRERESACTRESLVCVFLHSIFDNHLLMTLFIFLLETQACWWVYVRKRGEGRFLGLLLAFCRLKNCGCNTSNQELCI